MPVITCNFEPDFYINPQTKKLDVIYRPYVFIKLGFRSKLSKNLIRSLVDSGADFNTFPAPFATELGIDYKKGQQHKTSGVGGQIITAYLNIIKIEFDSRIIDTVVSFGDEIEIPLLGRNGFFNYFDRVTFKLKEKLTEFKY